MTISDSQKEQLAKWLDQGLSLSDIQKNVSSEFGISMTYMDLRFLIDDLELEVKDNKPKADEAEADDQPEEIDAALAEDDASGVQVEIDAVKRPGAVLSGEVTFSDGQHLSWQLDQFGRLGLIPSADTPDGYEPSPEDAEAFQTQLQKQIQSQSGI